MFGVGLALEDPAVPLPGVVDGEPVVADVPVAVVDEVSDAEEVAVAEAPDLVLAEPVAPFRSVEVALAPSTAPAAEARFPNPEYVCK